jgi:plasmid replication initiation protein
VTPRRGIDLQPDLFVPMLSDLQLRDQRETMERPFFSLCKRKRLAPINYVSPDGAVYVKVLPHPQYGMATIWDADLLIWAASTLNDMKKRGVNDIPRRLQARPYELLKSIGRDVGGENARQLHEAALRLRNTSITTNLRTKPGEVESNFSWLSEVRVTKKRHGGAGEQKKREYVGFTITVSEWFWDAVLQDGALLAIDPAYFSITGGRERWLYRIVRKHAGGAGPNGIAMKFTTLFEKSGAEGTYRRFKFELLKIIARNALPGFDMALETRPGDKEPWLFMLRKGLCPAAATETMASVAVATPTAAMFPPLSDQTLSLIRGNYPGLDVYALKADFDARLSGAKPPEDYQKAFYDFVQQRFHPLAV